MRVFPNVVPFVFSLGATTIIKSGVYPIRLYITKFIKIDLVVFVRRRIVRRSFHRQRDLVDKSDVVIKIHVSKF